MLAFEPDDHRPPFVKVASSIRAAILTGELKPGEQLPSGHDLAKFFGVARMTVQQAIRILRDEGFVVSYAGSGVYVRERPVQQEDTEESSELAGAITFLHELGYLKRLPRTGWFLVGVKQPESVAEHSFRTAVVGSLLAAMEGADVGRTALLCLLHDSPESRVGDIPSVGRAYISTVKAEAVSRDQTASMPEPLGELVQGVVQEYEADDSVEARLAHDADKIETLLQAREYQAQGQYNTEPWQDTSIASLKTDAGKALALAAQHVDPEHWWKAFAQSYSELRRATRGKRG